MMSKRRQTQKNTFRMALSYEVQEWEKLIYGDKNKNGVGGQYH